MATVSELDKSKVLQKSSGRLFRSGDEMGRYAGLVKLCYRQIYFELFKTILFTPGAKDLTYNNEITCDVKTKFMNDVLQPAIDKVNAYIKESVVPQFVNRLGKGDEKVNEEEITDYLDFTQYAEFARITNPQAKDIFPKLTVSYVSFAEAEIGKLLSPLELSPEIPVITIFPSIDGVFNFDKMYSEYSPGRTRDAESAAILEISAQSLIRDVLTLLEYVDVENGSGTGEIDLKPEGEPFLLAAIDKYTDFTVPLIVINLRKDYQNYTKFLSDLYTDYQKYNAMQAAWSRQFYVMADTVLKSPVGIALARINSIRYLTSTLYLLRENNPHSVAMYELNRSQGGDINTYRYLDRIREINPEIREKVTLYYTAIRGEMYGAMSEILRHFMSCIMAYFEFGAFNDIGEITEIIGREIEKVTGNNLGMPYDARFISKDFRKLVNSASMKALEKELAYALKRPAKTKFGRMVTPGSPGYIDFADEIELRRMQMIKNREVVTEDGEIIREIMSSGESGRYMHWIKNRLENAVRIEEYMGIHLDCTNMAEFAKLSPIQPEKKQQFMNFLSNAKRIATENMNKFMYEMEM